MDADTYPREDVKKALLAYVCVHINAEKAGESEQVAKQFGVNSYPRLMLVDPMGRKLMEIKGKPSAEGFGERLPAEIQEQLEAAVSAGDFKAAADRMAILRHWFEGTGARKAADGIYARLESNEEFKSAYDAAVSKLEAELAKAKEDAVKAHEIAEKARAEAEIKERKDLMAQASDLSKKSKRNEAIEIWKKVYARWPDSEEGKTAKGKLKFFGVKVEEPK